MLLIIAPSMINLDEETKEETLGDARSKRPKFHEHCDRKFKKLIFTGLPKFSFLLSTAHKLCKKCIGSL
jgi:hypothetical protein